MLYKEKFLKDFKRGLQVRKGLLRYVSNLYGGTEKDATINEVSESVYIINKNNKKYEITVQNESFQIKSTKEGILRIDSFSKENDELIHSCNGIRKNANNQMEIMYSGTVYYKVPEDYDLLVSDFRQAEFVKTDVKELKK